MIPFRDFNSGEVHGYIGRNIGAEEPKYLVPSGFPKSEYLFGGFELREQKPKVGLLVESPLAAMKVAPARFSGLCCLRLESIRRTDSDSHPDCKGVDLPAR